MTDRMDDYLERYPPPREAGLDRDDEPGRDCRGRSKTAPVERRIDLHGATVDDGRRRLDRFVRDAARRGVRKILVIHGTGDTPGELSPLRRMVRQYLEQNPLVGRYGTPDTANGGRGATWAVLRQRSR
ncbi:MAG: Smr/MutS family protein [Alkalispirochaeta sp.]